MDITRVTHENEEYGYLAIQHLSNPEREKKQVNSSFFEHEYNVMYVALDNEQVVGMVYGYELERPDSESKQLFIYSIDVASSHRRKHIATRLLKAILKPLEEGKYREAFVITNQTNDAAMNLYASINGKIVTLNDDHDVMFVFKF